MLIAPLSLTLSFLQSLGAPPPPAQEAAPPPSDAPRGLTLRAEGASAGYVLYAPLMHGRTLLLDAAGEIVHAWSHGLPTMSNVLLENGHLMTLVRLDDNPTFFGGGIGGRLVEYDWDGKIVWDYTLSNEKRILHHDFEVLPSGNVLVIAWEHHTRDEAIALGRDPAAVGDVGWWTDAVYELQPLRTAGGPGGAKIVWEWRMSDHLVQDLDATKKNHGSPADRPELVDANFDLRATPPMTPEEAARQKERERAMRQLGYAGGDDDEDDPDAKPDGAAPASAPKPPPDPRQRAKERGDWTHVNSVDFDAADDLILLSSPELCEIFVIDHATTSDEARTGRGGKRGQGGRLLWRWGNPRNYGLGSDADKQLFYQHQPEWIPAGLPGAGRVLVFNNGSRRPGVEFSSVDELVLPFDAARGFSREAGKPFGPAQPAWSYAAEKREDFFSFFISGCHRLANGNTFICSGHQGRLFEVTPEKRIVWEFWNPWGGEIPHSSGKAAPKRDGPPRPSPVKPVSVFRATKLAPDHPGLKGRTLTPVGSR